MDAFFCSLVRRPVRPLVRHRVPALALLLSPLCTPAPAQNVPANPLTVIVSFPAGFKPG